MEMKHLASEGNGTVHQVNLREHLEKEKTHENNNKERDVGEENEEPVPELPEEYYHGLEDLPWNLKSLEQSLYLSLPQWIKAALLCNLAGQYGIWTFHNNFLPCRLMSYLLLPYTLPATVTVSVSYRLLCWMRQILGKAASVLTDMVRALGLLPIFFMLHMKRLLLSRRYESKTKVSFWSFSLALPCLVLSSFAYTPFKSSSSSPSCFALCATVLFWPPFGTSNYSPASRGSSSTHNSARSVSSCPPSTVPTLRGLD
ncbi:hypothetical protein NFI96_012026, partial [Prochilodus magdalenae]